MLENKNAQAADTLTWFVAFIVIFFIMLLFIGLVVVLVPQISKDKLGGWKKDEIVVEKYGDISLARKYHDFAISQLVVKIIDENQGILSKWVDDGCSYDPVQAEGEGCHYYGIMQLKEDVCSSLKENSEQLNNLGSYYQICIEDKAAGQVETIFITKEDCGTHHLGQVCYDDNQQRNTYKFYFLSDKGNRVNVFLEVYDG